MDIGFVRRTYRSALFVAGFLLFLLASFGQFWALLPVFAGSLLGIGLLYGMEWFVRRTFTADRAAKVRPYAKDAKKNLKTSGAGRALFAFALVKYPLVAVLLWVLTRTGTTRDVLAFTGGFILIQFVIALRGIGCYLTKRSSHGDPFPKTAPMWKE